MKMASSALYEPVPTKEDSELGLSLYQQFNRGKRWWKSWVFAFAIIQILELVLFLAWESSKIGIFTFTPGDEVSRSCKTNLELIIPFCVHLKLTKKTSRYMTLKRASTSTTSFTRKRSTVASSTTPCGEASSLVCPHIT